MFWNYLVESGFSISLLVNALLFIPQIIIIRKTKNVKDLSLLTFGGFNIIQLFTLFHGLFNHDYILAFGYFLSVLTCGTVSGLIFYYRYIKKTS